MAAPRQEPVMQSLGVGFHVALQIPDFQRVTNPATEVSREERTYGAVD